MPRNSRIILCCLLALVLFSATVCPGKIRADAESTPQTIELLIKSVAQSRLMFVRNGKKHTSHEAAEHMREKYAYFRSKVKTPEDFIRLCASKSLLSGKPYLVVTHQGTIPVAIWLRQKLAKHLQSQHHSRDVRLLT